MNKDSQTDKKTRIHTRTHTHTHTSERSKPDKAHPNCYFLSEILLVRKVERPLSSWCVLAGCVLHDDDDDDDDNDDDDED